MYRPGIFRRRYTYELRAKRLLSRVIRTKTVSSVVITDVNTTESWSDGATGLVITGTGFV